MMSKADIEADIQHLVNAELDRRVALASERLPRRCKHNHLHTLDQRHLVGGERNEEYNRITNKRGLPIAQVIGLCMLGSDNPETWGGTICEEPIDAKRCPVFDPAESKDQLWKQFKTQLADPEWVKEQMPEVDTLLRVLGQSGRPLQPSWWKRLLLWFKVIRPEPAKLAPTYDISKLFEP